MTFPESSIIPEGVRVQTDQAHINDVRRDAFNNPALIGGRLTTASGSPTGGGFAAGTIYYTPYLHDRVPVWDGTRWVSTVFTQRSLSLFGHDANTNYDVFLYDSGGTLTLVDAAWVSDTARAVTLVMQDGLLVDQAHPERLFLGTFRTRGDVATQTDDNVAFRMLSNYYNRLPRQLFGIPEASVSGTISAGANGVELHSGFRVHWVACADDVFLALDFLGTYYENAVWNNRISIRGHVSNFNPGAATIGDVDTTAGHGGQLHFNVRRTVSPGWDYAKVLGYAEAGGGFKWRSAGYHGTTGFIMG